MELGEAIVLDRTGAHRRLGDVWARRPALVIFLRHFGCIGCAAQVDAVVPRLPELSALGVGLVLVGNGAPEFIDAFVQRQALDGRPVEIFTDPSLAVFRAAGLRRSRWASAGPRALLELMRAFFDGHRGAGTLQGDAWQQGGALLVDTDGTIAFQHRSESLGHAARPAELIAAALALTARRETGWTL